MGATKGIEGRQTEERVEEGRGAEVTTGRRMARVEEVKYVCGSDGKGESCPERERNIKKKKVEEGRKARGSPDGRGGRDESQMGGRG